MTVFAASHRQRLRLELLSGGFAVLAVGASIELLDQPVIGFLRANVSGGLLTLAVIVGVLGSPIPYFTVSAVAFIYYKMVQHSGVRANRALFVLLASTAAPFWTDILKLVFGRSRPELFLEQGIYVFHPLTNSLDFSSFPSEHATVAASMAATFSMVMPAYRPTFFFLATIVASSRIIIGVHYPSDAIAGMLVGLTAVAILSAAFRHYNIELQLTRYPPS